MAHTVSCNTCGVHLRVPDTALGKTVQCPKCGASFGVDSTPAEEHVPVEQVPAAPGALAPAPRSPGTVLCPYCSEPIQAAAKKCKHCGEILDVALREARERRAGYRASDSLTDKRILPAFLLCFFLGAFGAHRFYAGKVGTGIVMFVVSCTLVGLLVTGIWSLIDMIIIICGSFTDGDGTRITEWT